MQGDEAKVLLGFPPRSYPSTSQVKAAYRKRVWETHPDRFPNYEKARAESKFKLISEAYTCLNSGGSGEGSQTVSYSRVVRSGVPRSIGGRRNLALTSVPYFLIVLGAVTLGGQLLPGLTGNRKRLVLLTTPSSLDHECPHSTSLLQLISGNFV